jgi:hypothetical protein
MANPNVDTTFLFMFRIDLPRPALTVLKMIALLQGVKSDWQRKSTVGGTIQEKS